MINSQYGFLSSMLDRFPSLLNDWIMKQEEEVEQLAKEYAEGDEEVYMDTYNSEISRVDPCYDEELLFNQAMLIMVYSYFESSILRLAKEKGINTPRPSVIATKLGATLDDDQLKISNYLFKTIAPLRNQLCHNNQGTLFERSTNKREEQIENIGKLVEKKFIAIEEGRIVFVDRSFIKKVLDGEHKLLLKLVEICGFKTRWYKNKNGKMVMYERYDEVEKENM